MASINFKCIWCWKDVKIDITSDQLKRYEAWRITQGALIQDYLPDLSVDDRELLISGTCKKCWEKYIGNEEW